MVHESKLKGHKGGSSVLSLAHSSDIVSSFRRPKNKKKKANNKNVSIQQQQEGNTHNNNNNNNSNKNYLCHLLSGDDTGTTRVWDLRCNTKRASHCIVAPDNGGDERDVTAVAFHPLSDIESMIDTNSNAINIDRGTCPFTVYTAVGRYIYGYDLRYTKSPSIISNHDIQIIPINNSGEEINCLDFCHITRENKTYLAAADDDGVVRVYDSVPGQKDGSNHINLNVKPYRAYQHAEDELVLATSVSFRPQSFKSLDIATAGTDCTINLWDINRPHNKPSSSLVITQDGSENSAQIVNPPIVHSLSWSASGRLLSAGLGDGTCLIACVDGRKLVESCRLRGGHNSAVASVLFPNFSLTSLQHNIAAEDRLMISAGTDGNIILWDLGSVIAGCDAIDPSSKILDCNKRSSDVEEASDALQGKMLFGIPHKEKINFVSSSKSDDFQLFVADTSNDITVYTLPLI